MVSAASTALALAADGFLSPRSEMPLPAIIVAAGERASRRFIKFFTANIRNRNTRAAYAHAIGRFFGWCEANHLALERLEPVMIPAYVEKLMAVNSAPTVKQHLAAIRMLMDWLVVGQVLPMNPAASVRGPKHVVKKGKTLLLSAEQARQLLDSIDIMTLVGKRDRALIAAMVYSFAQVSAVTNMNVEDYWQIGKRWWLRLHEKGGKHHEVPAHHFAEEYLNVYLHAAKKTLLFRSAAGRSGTLTANRMNRRDVWHMIRRRAHSAGLPLLRVRLIVSAFSQDIFLTDRVFLAKNHIIFELVGNRRPDKIYLTLNKNLLPHVPRDRYHSLFGERRHDRNRSKYCRP